MNEFTLNKPSLHVSNTTRYSYSIINCIKKSKNTKQYFTNQSNTIKHYFNFTRFRTLHVAIILKYIIRVNNTPLIDHAFVTIILKNNCKDPIYRYNDYCLRMQNIFDINIKDYFNIMFEKTTYFHVLFC